MKERPIIFSTEMVQAILDGRKCQTRRVITPQPDSFDCIKYYPEIMWPSESGHKGQAPCVFLNNRKSEFKGQMQRYWNRWTVDCDPLEDELRYRYAVKCPFGDIGDRLYVRETWCKCLPVSPFDRQLVHMDRGNIIEQPTKGPDGEWDYHSGEMIIYRADGETEWCDDDGFMDYRSHWKPSIHMPKKYARIWLEVTNVRVERVQDISEEDARAEGPMPNWYGDLDKGYGGPWSPDHHGYLCQEAIKNPEREFDYYFKTGRDAFQSLWDSINKSRGFGWDVNPWVWVVEFKVVDHD